MSKANKNTITEELLFRHFAGEVSPDEHEFIESWIADSEENRKEYERMHIFYLDTKALSSLQKKGHIYDEELAWQKVSTQHKFSARAPGGINVSYKYLRIAAVAMVVLIGGWFGYNTFFSVSEIALMSENETVKQSLADGSLISLNTNSRLTYPDKFEGTERKVTLTGEAYFNISPNPDKPFVIETPEVEIKVVGTSFNVNASDSSDSVLVSVDTGIVLMRSDFKQETLESGTTGIYYKSTKVLVKVESDPTGVYNYWRTKQLNFNGTTLAEVVMALKMAYGKNIILSNPAIGRCKITVSFENEPLENILEIIATTLRLEVSQQNGVYTLTGDGCN